MIAGGAAARPQLSWWPASNGTCGGGELGISNFGLWLWPLPPPEAFEFAVEWPYAGIQLTTTELDGTAITQTANTPFYYWPDSEQETR